ncbi:MAG: MMPL family transporter [Candidatus Nanohaloarchaea archaeon]
MENPLELLAETQVEQTGLLIIAGFVLTAVLATGIPSIQLQTDFQSSLPDSIPAIQTQDKVNSQFGSSNAIIILFKTNDKPREDGFVTDVRDPRLLKSQKFLAGQLREEPIVGEVQSPASFFQTIPDSETGVRQMVSRIGADEFFNRDHTASLMFVQLNEEMNEKNIKKATSTIQENIDQTPMYPGMDVTITGLPVIRTDIGKVLVSDSVTTISAASVLILILLTLTRGIVYGPITFIPLFVGLIWTLGAMGLFGIPLTIATIALGSMILGLGVEYGSFITERILEEKRETDVENAVRNAVPTTGLAILGSSSTTVIGFSALLIASISFIRNLGLTLALGIVLTLSAALVLTPALVIEYERWSQ